MHARFVRRRVKEWRLQRACTGRASSAGCVRGRTPSRRSGNRRARFHFLLDGFPGEHIVGNNVAESAARANIRPAAIHFHLQGVAASGRRFGRRVAQQIIFALFARNLFQTRHQVIRIQDRKSTCAARQRVHHLLIGGCRRGKLRNNLPRLSVRRIAARVDTSRATGPAFSAARASAGAAGTPTFTSACPAARSPPRGPVLGPPPVPPPPPCPPPPAPPPPPLCCAARRSAAAAG